MIGKVICIKSYPRRTTVSVFKKNEEYLYTDKMFTVMRLKYIGYNVSFSKGEYLFFPFNEFNEHFKTLNQIRKEKLEKINNI